MSDDGADMVGYANNAARYCLGKPSMPNPAIVEIG